jgi:hypothetical protein
MGFGAGVPAPICHDKSAFVEAACRSDQKRSICLTMLSGRGLECAPGVLDS